MFTNATPVLDQLLVGQIIDQAAHEAATQKFEELALPREPFHTLGTGLFWLLENGILSAEALDELESLSAQEQEGASAVNAIRKQAVAELATHISAQQLASFDRQLWASMFPGPRWAWLTGGSVATLFAGWFFLAPDATPPCADKRVESALKSALVDVAFGDSSKPWFGAAKDRPNPLSARFTDIKEIGYIKAERSRGCSAMLTMDQTSVPMAFTVGPEHGSSEIIVRGGDRRMIEAKYGRANKDGTAPKLGAPIGKTQLAAAFSSGVEDFEKRTASVSTPALKEMDRRRGVDTGRKTIQSVEPLADCLAIEPGKKYTCRLQVQYIDRVLAVFGKSDMQVVQGDFDFVKQGEGWAMSDDFSRQYTDAIVRGRLGALKGDEAAQELEDIQKNRGKEAASADK
ncbi:hypothetical protein M2282_005791 [Variovorax boronicumulans]|uniref:hypothetical protein n=1 Tax=Variovorax boronicumulans TaxID=436515 RepID=UPI0024741D2A|nr:hypothetical protein [Variovorax boronicumulans]MDH6170616.1 hypothetical protein [Variovorax boronicumulans]